ncbi:MAG: hypothetical protein AAFU79_14255, partial [Myxococcota bacterium]
MKRRGLLSISSVMALGVVLLPSGAEAKRVVFVNFESVEINDTGNDPSTDSFSSNGFNPGPVEGWKNATEEDKALLIYWLKEAATPFDIEIVTERPNAGEYDMVVFGSDADHEGRFGGACSRSVGLSDCVFIGAAVERERDGWTARVDAV